MSSPLSQYQDGWRKQRRLKPQEVRDALDRMAEQSRAVLAGLTALHEEMNEFRRQTGMKPIGRPRVRTGDRMSHREIMARVKERIGRK